MLNLDETLDLIKPYNNQRDFYIKAGCYSTGVIVFLDIVRGQVPQINLLQLVPGFYLGLLCLFFFF